MTKKHNFLKDQDAWVTVFFFDQLSTPLALFIAKRVGILKPDHLTFFSLYGYVVALILLFHNFIWLAFLCMLASTILDCTDGKLARILKSPTAHGQYVDAGADFLIHSFGFLAIAFWHYTQTGYLCAVLISIWSLYLGVMHINSVTKFNYPKSGSPNSPEGKWPKFCRQRRLITNPFSDVEMAFIVIPLTILVNDLAGVLMVISTIVFMFNRKLFRYNNA